MIGKLQLACSLAVALETLDTDTADMASILMSPECAH